MDDPTPLRAPPRRSLLWRLACATVAALLGGVAVVLFVWPQALAYAVAVVFGLLALLAFAAALLAR